MQETSKNLTFKMNSENKKCHKYLKLKFQLFPDNPLSGQNKNEVSSQCVFDVKAYHINW